MPSFHKGGKPISGVAVMLALIASVGGFIFGYDTGQISDMLLMDDFKLRFATCTDSLDPQSCEFSDVRAGLIVSLLSIGTLAGALAGAEVADFLGRRWAIITESILFSVGLVIQMTAFTVWQQVAVGRFVAGMGVGALSAVVPMYQAETAPPHIRGTLTATYQLFITAGILVAYVVSIATRNVPGQGSWKIVVGLGFLWAVMLIVGILFMPESPRWLATRGRRDKAVEAVARVHGVPKGERESNRQVQEEVDRIFKQYEFEKNLKAGWIDCFKPNNKTLYRTLLGMSLQSLQQLTGANYFFYYGATIFEGVGVADPFVSQIILGAVNFVCTFGGLYVMEKFGRRMPLIYGGLWQSLWLFVFAAVGTAKDPQTDLVAGKLMIASACLFILGFATTWAPGIWILIGETFPTRTRAKQGALSTASNWIWNFLLAFFTPFITSAIGFSYGFIFAGCNLVGAVVVYFFLYESSGHSLEDVDNMYNDPTCKAWKSRHWRSPTENAAQSSLQDPNTEKKVYDAGGEEQHIEHAGVRNEAPRSSIATGDETLAERRSFEPPKEKSKLSHEL
ncbi:general substrate transporter [Coprinopsis sp. MPI-PUGE-AT-0042]|nr:general substrate transporter [Coprinopsis sp. MPI-PUGE-AT-0042]